MQNICSIFSLNSDLFCFLTSFVELSTNWFQVEVAVDENHVNLLQNKGIFYLPIYKFYKFYNDCDAGSSETLMISRVEIFFISPH